MKIKLERIYGRQGKYVTRLIIGRFRLQKFHRGDEDPDPHTHPADFWTFPLVEYYEEYLHTVPIGGTEYYAHKRYGGGDQYLRVRRVRRFRWHFRPAEYCHRILYPANANGGSYDGYSNQIVDTRYGITEGARSKAARWPIWTLNWWGPKRQEWGFVRDGKLVPWRQYIREKGLRLLE